ncbi:hypothetical protein MRX96_044920 [Rhipicephalus microplus]
MKNAVISVLVFMLAQPSFAKSVANASGNNSLSSDTPNTTATETGGDNFDGVAALRGALARSFASIPSSIKFRLLRAEVSTECRLGLLRTLRGFLRLEPWALRLFDATGKYPTGLFQGSRADMGAFDQCLETVAYDKNGNLLTRGQYCNLVAYSKNGPAIKGLLQSLSDVLHPKVRETCVETLILAVVCVPLFFIIMCFYLLPRFVTGPNAKTGFQILFKEVANHWWHLILQIRNFYESSIWHVRQIIDSLGRARCHVVLARRLVHDQLAKLHTAWDGSDTYLEANGHKSIVADAPLHRKRALVAAFSMLSLLGCAIGTWVVARHQLQPMVVFPGPIVPLMKQTFSEYYMKPYYHAVCYFSGCMTFILMEDFKKRKIAKVTLGFAVLIWSFLLSYFVFLACEAPITKLNSLIFGRITAKRDSRPPKQLEVFALEDENGEA